MTDTELFRYRRLAHRTLIAELTAAFLIALGAFAWAEVNPAAAERTPVVAGATAPAPPSAPSPESQNEFLGCGCAEGCRG